MASAHYRVVLTGDLLPGFARSGVVDALARLFDKPASSVEQALEAGELRIAGLLEEPAASALKRRLEDIGAAARVEPAPAVDNEAGGAGAWSGRDQPAARPGQGAPHADPDLGAVVAETSPPPAPGGPRPRRPQPVQDVHALARRDWHEGWLDGADQQPSEQHHVRLFMGPDSPHLYEACERMMLGRRTRPMLSWADGAVLSPFLWAMYRKLYAWGIVIFAFEILIPVALISFGSKYGVPGILLFLGAGLVVANRIFWPAVLKYLYCRHARCTITYLNRLSPTFAADIDIATRGGTSRTSVFVGLVMALVASLLTWSVVDSLYERLVEPHLTFSTADALARPPEVGEQQTGTPSLSDEDARLMNENRWVATRMRLRRLSQQIDVWLDGSGREVNPARLTIADVARALELDPRSTLDGWGRRVSFRSDGKVYKLISAGPDGEFGTDDDVEYRRTRKH